MPDYRFRYGGEIFILGGHGNWLVGISGLHQPGLNHPFRPAWG